MNYEKLKYIKLKPYLLFFQRFVLLKSFKPHVQYSAEDFSFMNFFIPLIHHIISLTPLKNTLWHKRNFEKVWSTLLKFKLALPLLTSRNIALLNSCDQHFFYSAFSTLFYQDWSLKVSTRRKKKKRQILSIFLNWFSNGVASDCGI